MRTISVHAYDEVVAHGPCLAQLVRVAVMHHVIAVETKRVGVPRVGARWPCGLGAEFCSSEDSLGSTLRSCCWEPWDWDSEDVGA